MFVISQVFLIFFIALFSLSTDASNNTDTPNILMLMLEDLSPRLGTYGDSVAVTPNIDKLADEGVRYTNVFSTAGICAPSRAARHQQSSIPETLCSQGRGRYYCGNSHPNNNVKRY